MLKKIKITKYRVNKKVYDGIWCLKSIYDGFMTLSCHNPNFGGLHPQHCDTMT